MKILELLKFIFVFCIVFVDIGYAGLEIVQSEAPEIDTFKEYTKIDDLRPQRQEDEFEYLSSQLNSLYRKISDSNMKYKPSLNELWEDYFQSKYISIDVDYFLNNSDFKEGKRYLELYKQQFGENSYYTARKATLKLLENKHDLPSILKSYKDLYEKGKISKKHYASMLEDIFFYTEPQSNKEIEEKLSFLNLNDGNNTNLLDVLTDLDPTFYGSSFSKYPEIIDKILSDKKYSKIHPKISCNLQEYIKVKSNSVNDDEERDLISEWTMKIINIYKKIETNSHLDEKLSWHKTCNNGQSLYDAIKTIIEEGFLDAYLEIAPVGEKKELIEIVNANFNEIDALCVETWRISNFLNKILKDIKVYGDQRVKKNSSSNLMMQDCNIEVKISSPLDHLSVNNARIMNLKISKNNYTLSPDFPKNGALINDLIIQLEK